MQRISSNYTAFLKLFLPTFWLVFFGFFVIASLIFENESNPVFNTTAFKVGLISFYIGVAVFFYFTFLKLKRVDFGKDQFFVSNYFKTYKYEYKDIESMDEHNYIVIKTIRLKFKGPSSFGRSVSFIPQSKFLMDFVKDHPHHFEHLNQ